MWIIHFSTMKTRTQYFAIILCHYATFLVCQIYDSTTILYLQ